MTTVKADHATDARLIAAAPDHAVYARAITSGAIRWEWFTGSQTAGELCCDGLRYATELDEFGVPRLEDHTRAAIAKAEGTQP
jgi:hypothetical protein